MIDPQEKDAVYCQNEIHEESVKLRVVQSGTLDHEGHTFTWRRKRCPQCGRLHKTVEVPFDLAQKLFPKTPFKIVYP